MIGLMVRKQFKNTEKTNLVTSVHTHPNTVQAYVSKLCEQNYTYNLKNRVNKSHLRNTVGDRYVEGVHGDFSQWQIKLGIMLCP